MPGFSGADARREVASELTTWTDEDEADMIDSSILPCDVRSVSWVGPVDSAPPRTLCVSGWAKKMFVGDSPLTPCVLSQNFR